MIGEPRLLDEEFPGVFSFLIDKESFLLEFSALIVVSNSIVLSKLEVLLLPSVTEFVPLFTENLGLLGDRSLHVVVSVLSAVHNVG